MTEIIKFLGGKKVVDEQDIQNAAADKGSYYFNNNSINMGALGAGYTGNFTALITFSQKSYGMIYNAGGVGAADVYIYSTDNGLAFTNGLGQGHPTNPGIAAIINEVIYTAVGVYDGSSRKLYLNGVQAYSDPQTALALASNLSSLGKDVQGTTSTFSGSVFRHILFNYALPADKIARYSAGAKLDFEDVGGSMTDISAGATWTNVSLSSYTATGNDITSYTATVQYSYAILPISVKSGKKVRVYLTLTGTSNQMLLGLVDSGFSFVSNTPYITTTTPYIDLTPTADCTYLLFMLGGAGPSTGSLEIHKVVQLGAVLDLEPENITDGTWFDASPNGLHGTVTGALANNIQESFRTKRITANLTSGVATTYYTATAGKIGVWLVTIAGLGGNTVNYSAWAIIAQHGTSLKRLTGTDSSLMTITVSGSDIQVTQTAGSNQNVEVSFLLMR